MITNIRDMACGEIILEELTEMMMAQDPKDRMHYVDIASEAVLSPVGKSNLIQQLYTDIISKSNIDFGKIPDSKGNITAYEYYDPMAKSIDALNQLFGDKKVDEIELLNKLHNIIIECRGDFEYGYKFDVEFIQLTYCLLVMALYDMIGVCIAKYTNYLKDIKGVEFKFTETKNNKNLLIRAAKSFIKGYESGEWNKMITSFKKHPDEVKTMGAPAVASEGFGSSSALKTAVLAGGGKLMVMSGNAALASIGPLFYCFAAFVAIKLLVYLYYYVPFKINEGIKIQSQFLKSSIEMNSDTSVNSLEKQKKMLSNLQHISNFIETRILKINTTAKKALDEDTKKNYSKSDLLAAGGEDFELM